MIPIAISPISTARSSKIRADGFYKSERVIRTPQAPASSWQAAPRSSTSARTTTSGSPTIPASSPRRRRARPLRLRHGVRALHLRHARACIGSSKWRFAAFLDVDDAILYSSCFDANGGLFETLLSEEDAVLSDELNHASIVDGIRLCKARRYRYRNNDMGDLAARLAEADAAGARFKLIATDGVFSMDGIVADLRSICDLAEEHGALVMVDDSHAVGFVGANGRGTPELCGVGGRVDILTGTLGKALGGASGRLYRGTRPKSSSSCASARARIFFRTRSRLASRPRPSRS
jgi:glycine C-acetyltransferase